MIVKKYKYITIRTNGEFSNKPKYKIINNKSKKIIGILFYYVPWHQYVFTQYKENQIFNNSCLLDIVNFIDNIS